MVVIVVAVVVLTVLAAVLLFSALRRRDTSSLGQLARETRQRDRTARREAATAEAETHPSAQEVERAAVVARRGGELVRAEPAPPAPFVAPDPETLGVTRRQFLNRSIVGGFGLGLSGFGAGVLAFLWPQLQGGFGSKITVGSVTEIQGQITQNNGFYYYPEGRMWVTEFPASALDKARAVYTPPELAGMEAGLIALYQKCVHLGCRVPECETSQWFECPCHGSQYNQVGEKKGGPAPRGLDRFSMSVEGGNFVVDTSIIIEGPVIGTNTTGQEAEGPHCVGGASH